MGAPQLNQVYTANAVTGPNGAGFELVSNNSGLCLDVAGNGVGNGTRIDQAICNSQSNQVWRFVPYANGYEILSTASQRCLDLNSGNTGDGNYVQIWDCGSGTNINQIWQTNPEPSDSAVSPGGKSRAAPYDFDGDGKSDLLWYNNESGQVVIWPNGAAYGYSPGTVGPNSGWVISQVADFDGDGKADILWYNNFSGQLAVWPAGNPNGYSPGTVAPNSGWVVAKTGDFDGDGKADILWYNTQSGQVTIWPAANANAGYQIGVVPPGSGWVISQFADFDGDGKTDILWLNTATGEASVWPSANPSAAYTAGNVPLGFGWIISQVGDFDGDGRADVLLYNTNNGLTAVWPGANSAASYSLGSIPTTTVIAVAADINGDGKSDLVLYDQQSGNVSSLSGGNQNASSTLGNVGPNSGWRIKTNAAKKRHKVPSDFDGDGKSDLLWYNNQTGDISIWPDGQSAGGYNAGNVPPSSGWTIVKNGDFDGDYRSDILWYNTVSGQVVVWLGGNGGNSYSPGTVDPSSGWRIAQVGDFDGDSRDDILWYNTLSGQVSVWPGANAGAGYGIGTVPPSSGWLISQVADFDGDGRDDILWANSQTGQLSVWPGANEAANYSLANIPAGWTVAEAGDFDGDGKADLVLYNSSTGETSLWPSGSSAASYSLGTIPLNSGIIIAGTSDINGDGKSDLVLYNTQSGDATYLSGGYTTASTTLGNYSPTSGWSLKSNNPPTQPPISTSSPFSKDWSSIAQQIMAFPSESDAIAFGTKAGLVWVIADQISDSEFDADLVDPITGASVVHFVDSDNISFTGWTPTSPVAAPGGGTVNSSNTGSFVCPYPSGGYVNVNVTNSGGNPVVQQNSILYPGQTSVSINIPNTSSSGTFLNYSASQVANSLTASTGLSFSTSVTPAGASNVSGQITIQCGTTPGEGGNTDVRSTSTNGSSAPTAVITLPCSNYSSSSDLASLYDAIFHEVMHALGFPHDAGNNSMDYATTYGTGAGVLPPNAVAIIQGQVSKNNVSIDFTKCVRPQDYHKIQCGLNGAFEFCCPGSTYTPPAGYCAATATLPPPDPIPSLSPPPYNPVCVNAFGCSGGNTWDSFTCSCQCNVDPSSCPDGATFNAQACQCQKTWSKIVCEGYMSGRILS